MRPVRSEDQEFFRETTARFLDEFMSPQSVRALREDPVGFDPEYWRRGAELGWVSFLVSEDNGGGSISGLGLVDLTLVAHEFGMHAAAGPLVGSNLVAKALSDASSHLDELGAIVGGAVAGWCYTEPIPNDALGTITTSVVADGGDVVVNGVKRPVESANVAEYFLVTGRTGEGLTQVLVPAGTPGVSIKALKSVDLTRRFFTVTFDGVRLPASAVVGEVGGAAEAVERQMEVANVVANAEAVGAMQKGFDITHEWAFDRYSFGRPLSSYQALKHRYADMKLWLEASHAVNDAAAQALAVAPGEPSTSELVSVASSYIGDKGVDLLQDCVQLHGGLGVTYEHDIHLYLRRQALNRTLFGTPGEHRLRIADIAEQRGDVA